MIKNLLIYMILGIPWLGNTQIGNPVLLTTSTKDILMAAGSKNGEHFAYVTEDGLNTNYDGKRNVYDKIEYTLQSTKYSTQLKGNIKNISSNSNGRIYVSTFDNHVIMFEKGIYLAGIPLLANDFHQDWEGSVHANIFFNNNWLVARFLNSPYQLDVSILSDIYPAIQSSINLAKPQQVSVNEGPIVAITTQNNKDIIIGYESGHEIKWHKVPESVLPCDSIVDISQAGPLSIVNGGASNYQVYTLCNDGTIHVMTKKITDASGFTQQWTSADWTSLGEQVMGGKVLSINHSGRPYVIGCTDAAQNALFVINANKKVLCFADMPGSGRISHFFFSPYEETAIVTIGKQVYSVTFSPDFCQSGISSTNELSQAHITIIPNPSSGAFDIILPNYMDVSHLTIIDMQGKTHYHRSDIGSVSLISTDLSLSPGMYILQLTDSDNHTSTQKLIIH